MRYCVNLDGAALKQDVVTVRQRDSMRQETVLAQAEPPR
jgi:glycyl-tRNA synthetase (class II)